MRLEEDHEIAARAVLLATGAQYRRLPVDGLSDYEGHERVLRGRPARGAALRRLARRRRRRRQLGRPGRRLARPRRRARDAAPSPRRPARDDVGLPRPRARALRRRGARPQRDRRAARRRRPARGGHADDAASACRSRSCSSSSARCRAPTGSATRSHATTTASSSPAPPPAPTTCSRRACPASSPPATSARARPSAAPPPSAKARWPCSSSTLDSHVKRATARPANSHRVDEVAASASQALSRVTGMQGGFHIPCYPDSRRAGAQRSGNKTNAETRGGCAVCGARGVPSGGIGKPGSDADRQRELTLAILGPGPQPRSKTASPVVTNVLHERRCAIPARLASSSRRRRTTARGGVVMAAVTTGNGIEVRALREASA